MKYRTYTQIEAFLRTAFDVEGNSIKAVADTGLPKPDARELRQAYATMLNEAGIDMKAIGITMGHTKASTTEGYVGRPETDRPRSIRNAGINHILDKLRICFWTVQLPKTQKCRANNGTFTINRPTIQLSQKSRNLRA